MPIAIVCPACGQTSYVSDALLGSRTPCSSCKRYFIATAGPELAPVAGPASSSSDAEEYSLPPVARPAGSAGSARNAQQAHAQGPAHKGSPPKRRSSENAFLLGALSAGLVAVLSVAAVWLVLRPHNAPEAVQDAQNEPADPAPENEAAAPDRNANTGDTPPGATTAADASTAPNAPAAASGEPSKSSPDPPAQLNTEQIAERFEGAVALIKGKTESGTGFLAAPGLLVTNAHVIESEFVAGLTARFPSAAETDRGPFALVLVYEDPKRDLAILRVASSTAPLALAPAYAFKRGQEVTVIGNPGAFGGLLTLENAISRGVMSNNTWLEGQSFYQLTIAINPGNSGGPVINSTGQVIGVVTLKTSLEEGLAFCIPVEDVRKAVAQAAQQRPDQAARADSLHRLVIALRLLDASGRTYSAELDSYNEAMDQALRKRANIGDTMADLARGSIAKLKPLEQPRYDELQPEVLRLTAANELPADTRQGIIQLWSNYAEMKNWVEHPPSDVKEFHRKTLEMKTKHRQLVDSLKRGMGQDLAERVALVPIRGNSPPAPSGPPTSPDDPQAQPPALSIVDLSLRPETKAGYIKVFGKVKNLTAEPLEGIVAIVHVRNAQGTELKPTRVPVVPATIAPGAEGSFFTRMKLQNPKDRYRVEFTTSAGTPLTTLNTPRL